MDFELTSEQKAIQETVRKFAERDIAPRGEEIDKSDIFPPELIRRMGELGFTGLAFPEKYGGSGAGWLAHALAVEELNRVNSIAAIQVCAITLSGTPLYLFGTEEQKERWLIPYIKGEHQLAFASTEPGAGSDAGGISTTARKQDGEWIINGSKAFITNGGSPLCQAVIITAVTGQREDGRKTITQFIIPHQTPGFTVSEGYRKIGWVGVDTRELSFDDCRVPSDNLVGKEGKGLRQALAAMSISRIYIAAMAVGLAQGCLDLSLKYARERMAFGQPISKFQAIQFKLADMAAEIEAGRLLTYKAASLLDKGEPHSHQGSLAKLFSTEMAMRAANCAVDIHGAYGCMREYQVARFLGDSKILQIGEGTSEIQRLIIARELGC